TAVELALKAQELNVAFGANEDSPEKIFAAHRAIRDRLNDRKKSTAKTDLAAQHMEAARSLSENGFFEEAIARAKQAAELNVPFAPGDQRPEQLITEI